MSRTETLYFLLISSSTKCEPIKPLPPITKTFFLRHRLKMINITLILD